MNEKEAWKEKLHNLSNKKWEKIKDQIQKDSLKQLLSDLRVERITISVNEAGNIYLMSFEGKMNEIPEIILNFPHLESLSFDDNEIEKIKHVNKLTELKYLSFLNLTLKTRVGIREWAFF